MTVCSPKRISNQVNLWLGYGQSTVEVLAR